MPRVSARLATGKDRPESLASLFGAIPDRGVFVWVVVFSVVINTLLLILPLFAILVFDRVLTSGSIETLLALTALAFGALGFGAAFDVLRDRLLGRLAVRFEQNLAPLVLKAAITDPARRSEGGTHDIVRLRELRTLLSSNTIPMLIDAPFLPGFIVVLYLIHPYYGHIALAGAAVIAVLALVSQRIARAERDNAKAAAGLAQTTLDSIIRHANLIRVMGWRTGAVREFLRLNNEALAPVVRASERVATVASIARMIRLALQVAAIAVGAWLVLENEVLPGSMIASSIIISRTLAPMEHLVAAWRPLMSARDAWTRVRAAVASVFAEPRRTLQPPPSGAVGVQGLVFRTGEVRRPILAGVTFSCPPASVVVIIGPTGAGKSTLLRMIAGLARPTTGIIRLDGASLDQWDPDQLGRYVGYLPQEAELMGGTVAEAIAGFDETATDADVVRAALLANAHDMILSLPRGYQTEIGRDGSKLSGGQRQRIGLARAFFGERRLILLDEPNANLDHEGEEALCHAIREAKARGATVLVASHRPRLLTVADFILFLRDGTQVAFGVPGEVMPQSMSRSATVRSMKPAQSGAGS